MIIIIIISRKENSDFHFTGIKCIFVKSNQIKPNEMKSNNYSYVFLSKIL